MQKILDRKTKPATYAMDLNLVGDYWGENRANPLLMCCCGACLRKVSTDAF